MTAQLTMQPPVLDLSFYAGDGVSFLITCMDSSGPIDVSGAIAAQIRVDRLPATTPVVEFTSEFVPNETGVIKLTLTGDQTQSLMDDPSTKSGRFTGVWDLEWTATGLEPRTLCQGKVECLADVTR